MLSSLPFLMLLLLMIVPPGIAAPSTQIDDKLIENPDSVTGSSASIENIALNKPTFQTGTNWRGDSSRAVDGDKNAIFWSNSCSHTRLINNPWWAVDLESEYKLDSVILTNRGDCCADRLSNFIIGTTDVNPEIAAPTELTINVCHRQFEPLGASETRSFKCDAKGKYVVVLLLKDKAFLTLCEVEVYGKRDGKIIDDVPEITPNPIQFTIPNGFIAAIKGDRVKIPCAFSMTEDVPWILEWTMKQPHLSTTIPLYTYTPGGIDKATNSPFLRVERDNVSLIVQETNVNVSERRFCCRVSVPSMDRDEIKKEECMNVTYFPEPTGYSRRKVHKDVAYDVVVDKKEVAGNPQKEAADNVAQYSYLIDSVHRRRQPDWRKMLYTFIGGGITSACFLVVIIIIAVVVVVSKKRKGENLEAERQDP